MSRAALAALSLTACLLLPALAAAETYGKPLSAGDAVPVAKILADPDAYVGKRVRIAGQVTDVCPMKGCWMEIEEKAGGARLRVKVDDGVMVFPVTAKGKLAVAEGTVEAIPMEREEYVEWLAHLAEEKGEKFDAASVGAGPFRILQLRGEGARVE
jgi:hypothetical protein